MGIIIPGCIIKEKLNEGANFTIYKGFDKSIGENKALLFKFVKSSHLRYVDIERIKLDYKILQGVELDGTENVLGIIELDDELVLKLEYHNSINLKKFLNKEPIDLRIFLQIAVQLAKALGDIHKLDIIHSCLRPQNILINQEKNLIKLTNFGLLYLLTKEYRSFFDRVILEEHLPYVSPEQTGRVNKPMDFRTDFYSLGVMFYEMLTGKLPFYSKDPMELVHYHMAKKVRNPIELNDTIPESVSNIVLKLMAKNAEDRYQSGYGLERDLFKCLDRVLKIGKIEKFILGKNERPKDLIVSQKIYGRKNEIKHLIDAFNRISHGVSELVLVHGYAGIGKSTIVHEIHKPVISKNGYFIFGKYDQFKRDEPYSAIVQAIHGLIKQLSLENKERREGLKEALLSALGSYGNIIINMIPELELIIGKQPGVQKLGPIESQNRFRMAFTRFINVFAKKEHPLVVFLDDLQWIDSASLDLIEALITSAGVKYILLIGAYRSNEVSSSHQLNIKLNRIKKSAVSVKEISLGSLDNVDVHELIKDTMHCSEELSKPLAQLVYKKTAGNPFFIQQFLKTIYDEGLIKFNILSGWHWDINDVKKMEITDNVIELMTKKINKLSHNTQNVLKLASCIGNKFDPAILATLYKKPLDKMFSYLAETVREGFIIPSGYVYEFLHDRIREASYSLIPQNQKEDLHLEIGRLIQKHLKEEELPDKIFNVVDHLNIGKGIVTDQNEINEIIKLNIMAGKKAKASTAFGPALKYFKSALELLTMESWKSKYDTTFELYIELAECMYIEGDFSEAERLYNKALENAKTNVDKANVFNKKMVLYTIQHRIDDAIKCGKNGLKPFGLNLTLKPSKIMIQAELLKIKCRQNWKSPKDLINLPIIREDDKNIIMNLLTNMMPVAFFFSHNLFAYIGLRMINLSYKYGISAASSYVFSCYGIILGSGLYDYKTGYMFGRLGIQISEKFNDVHYKCQSNFIMGCFINHWTKHAKTSIKFLEKSYQAANESGNLIFTGYSLGLIVQIITIKGDSVSNVLEESKKYLAIVELTKDQIYIYILNIQRQWALNLKGLTRDQSSFSNIDFDEENCVEEMLGFRTKAPISWYYVIKLQTLYILNDYDEAIKTAFESEKFLDHIFGFMLVSEHYFYYSLTLTGLYPSLSLKEKKKSDITLKKNQKIMKRWANSCPENFLHKFLIIEAELARISGNDKKVIELYNQAIKSADKNEYTQNVAIANELAAKYCFKSGKNKKGREYLKMACNSYRIWGADAKVKILEEEYPDLLRIKESDDIAQNTDVLDLKTILKASNTISEEIYLDKLLIKLMRIVIETAGAQKGYLILEKNNELFIEAEGSIDNDEVMVLQSINLNDFDKISNKIVHHVIKNKESIVLNDAINEGSFTNDKCVLQNKLRSILCVPIFKQLNLIGILYVENNLTANAFTQKKIEILKLLSSQIAISLENARFFDETKRLNVKLNKEIVERKRVQEKEKRLITAMESVGDGIIISDCSGNIQYCNPAFERIFGYKQAEIIGSNMRIIKSGKQDKFFYENMWKTIKSGRTWKGRIINKKKDGTLITEMMTISPIYDMSSNIVNYVAVKRDITREVEIELRVQNSQKMEAIGTLAGGIAHDFNNLLTPIMIYTEMARNNLSKNLEKRDALGQVIKATTRAKELVNQILTFSRHDEQELCPVEIEPILNEVLKLLKASIPSKIDICKNIEKDCGLILANPIHIHQIVINLCTNAIYAMQENGGTLEINLSRFNVNPILAEKEDIEPGSYIKLTISDTGCGMLPEIKQRIFDPFFTTKDKGQGTGMGLSVVHGIVKSYSGAITVSSELKKGATFNLFFPKLESSAKFQDYIGNHISPKGRGNILFIDDEEYIANLGQHMLTPLGYSVLSKTSSVDALETFLSRPEKFDIVITDLSMPKINGDKLAKEMMCIKPNMPIILCTGYSDDINYGALEKIGFFRIIKKPYNTHVLAQAIWEALNN